MAGGITDKTKGGEREWRIQKEHTHWRALHALGARWDKCREQQQREKYVERHTSEAAYGVWLCVEIRWICARRKATPLKAKDRDSGTEPHTNHALTEPTATLPKTHTRTLHSKTQNTYTKANLPDSNLGPPRTNVSAPSTVRATRAELDGVYLGKTSLRKTRPGSSNGDYRVLSALLLCDVCQVTGVL